MSETHDLLDLLELEQVEEDLFRANVVFDEDFPLYGGQVAAQALRAAGLTVEEDRLPHSLHGYFLRAGDASRPTLFRVERDRDGRSFSARRVVAVQRGEVIFSTSVSFAAPGAGLDRQGPELPAVPPPEECVPWEVPRMFSMEVAIPPEDGVTAWPSRFWSRFTVPLGRDPLLHACAFAYLSDVSADLHRWDTSGFLPAASLDHAFWLHYPAPMDDWVFTDYTARSIAGNRGLYTGSVFDPSGRMFASVAQEALYRKLR